MVIFHCYASLPEGIPNQKTFSIIIALKGFISFQVAVLDQQKNMSFRAVASVDFFAMMTKSGFECVDSQRKDLPVKYVSFYS